MVTHVANTQTRKKFQFSKNHLILKIKIDYCNIFGEENLHKNFVHFKKLQKENPKFLFVFIVVLAQKVVNIGFDEGKEIITYFLEFLFKFSFFQPESFCYDQNENILWFS